MNVKTEENAPAEPLPVGTRLHRRYVVGSTMGRGACGVTYEGYDEGTRRSVAIKEYFPRAFAERAAGSNAVSPKTRACGEAFFLGAEAFLSQHHALTDAVGNPNVTSVYDAFFENGTAYAVMELLEGVTLERYLALRERPLSAGEAMYAAASMADALLVIDSLGILHHDINARSLFFCTDGTVKLAEFGAARVALRRRRAVDDAAPWTDLDALARTLYAAMTGRDARDGLAAHERVPAPLMALFRRMSEPDAARRLSSVFDYRHALACVETEAVRPSVSPEEAGVYELPRLARQAARAERREAERTPSDSEHTGRTAAEPGRAERRLAEEAERQGERRVRRMTLLWIGAALITLAGALILRAVLFGR